MRPNSPSPTGGEGRGAGAKFINRQVAFHLEFALYRRPCKNQKCFRARLTPKPWRCDAGKPPCRWPWLDTAFESSFKTWEGTYTAKCESLATCELVRKTSNQAVHTEVQLIVGLHDKAARATSKLALA